MWGAFVLRAVFIAAGVTLLRRFEWITWIFGLFLLYAAWRMVRGGSARAAIPEWIVRLQPAKGSLLPVILAVEVTDLLFATDSIPAVLSVTHNPFVAYTSNVAAILGLRSLYFALAAMLDRFRYLHYGLGATAGLCGAEDAGRPLDRRAGHAFAGGYWRDFGDVRSDNGNQGSEIRQQLGSRCPIRPALSAAEEMDADGRDSALLPFLMQGQKGGCPPQSCWDCAKVSKISSSTPILRCKRIQPSGVL